MVESSDSTKNRVLKLAVVGGIAAVVGVVCYFWLSREQRSSRSDDANDKTVKEQAQLLEDEKTKESRPSSAVPEVARPDHDATGQGRNKRQINVKTASQYEIVELLNDIRKNQSEMTALLDKAVQDCVANNFSVLEAYNLIAASQPRDPLEEHGLTLPDFDSLLERFSKDQVICDLVMDILQGDEKSQGAAAGTTGGSSSSMSSPTADKTSSSPAVDTKNLSVDEIIRINMSMYEELLRIVDEFERLDGNVIPSLDTRTASVAAQALVGAHITTKFQVTPENVEDAIARHQAELKIHEEFFRLNMQIQSTMNRLISRFN